MLQTYRVYADRVIHIPTHVPQPGMTSRGVRAPGAYGHAVALDATESLCGRSVIGLYGFAEHPFHRLAARLQCSECQERYRELAAAVHG